MTRPAALLFALLALPCLAAGQTLPLRQSSLDSSAADPLFRVPLDSTVDGRWLGSSPGTSRWDLDGRWLYFTYDTTVVVTDSVSPPDPWWRVSRDGRRVEAVERNVAAAVPASPTWTRDGRRAAWFQQGALHFWERGKGERVLLARANSLRPTWSADERELRWTEDDLLWSIDPASGILRQLTRVITKKDSVKDKPINAELKREQLELFDFVQRQKREADSSAARRLRERDPMPFVVVRPKKDDVLRGEELSPDGRWVSYLVSPKADETQTVWSDFVNDSGVVQTRTGRAKVGAPPVRTRIAIVAADPLVDPDSATITWVVDDTTAFGKPVRALSASWNRAGTHLLAEFASMDYRDRWIVTVDPATGKHLGQVHHEHDDAWLLESSGITWLPDDEHIAIISEVTGWQHLVALDMAGNARALTNGPWEVRSAQLSRDESTWWLTTSEEHPSELHLYTMPANGGPRTRIDQLGEGEVNWTVSPDEGALAIRWNSPDQLTDLYLMSTRTARPVRVTRSGSDAYFRIAWPRSDFVAYTNARGDSAWARVYVPRTQHPGHGAVLEIHGAGYAQGVHKSFGGSSAHGGALYAKYLTDLGLTYVRLDYQGSAGYGRDVRVAVYRTMGDRDVESAIGTVPYLAANYGVDPARVGLFGCSYGGFFTLMALFKHPGTFAGGVAQCAVTDWAHYNHWYTARILNGTPAEDTVAYRESSPIYHAAGLADPLILEHGLVDNNVEYQDAVRLVQRMMELGKDFEFVTYPIEAHGWRTSWSKRDSQRRMQQLWDRVLLR
ncbi:MAG: prolyl oligopeptidase family serine peptidase [Gemmatimonadota bacterium]